MQAVASPTSLPNLPNGNDFADWLSPILVKELRQGLKSRAFVATFIIVQAVMILLVGMQLLTLAGGGGRGALDTFDGFFWACVSLPLLVMMPARGLTAVSEEVRANTLDLVQLTRLSAFRIVFGKWVALVSQSLLLVAAILPYAVLRYFFGEVDVVGDMKRITLQLIFSIWLTAGAIALSSLHLVVRILVLVVLVPGLFIFSGMARIVTISGLFDWTWMAPIFAAVFTYLMLEIAAAKIAPISENHAAPKRLLALGLCVGGILLGVFGDAAQLTVWMGASILVCGWVMLEALSERTVMVPSLYTTFARRGTLGKLAGRVLYPGWASGLVFCTLIMGAALAVTWIQGSAQAAPSWERDREMIKLVAPIAFAALISPVVVLLLFPRVKQPMWLYILVQAICALLYLIATIAAETPRLDPEQTYRWLALLPTSTLLAIFDESDSESLRRFFRNVSLPVCGVLFVYLAARTLKEFKLISALERESLQSKKMNSDPDKPAA
jgi:hypothetical protein